eukprot:5318961-Prymnesium_polylepis.1
MAVVRPKASLSCAQVVELLRQYSSPQPHVLPEVIGCGVQQLRCAAVMRCAGVERVDGLLSTVAWWLHLPGQEVDARLQGEHAENFTLLMVASAHAGQSRLVELLLARNAQVDLRDNHGWTALMLAAHLGHVANLSTMITAAASTCLRSVDGRSALELAEASLNEVQISFQLKEQGRQPRDIAKGKAEAARILRAHIDSTIGALPDAIYAAARAGDVDTVEAWLE